MKMTRERQRTVGERLPYFPVRSPRDLFSPNGHERVRTPEVVRNPLRTPSDGHGRPRTQIFFDSHRLHCEQSRTRTNAFARFGHFAFPSGARSVRILVVPPLSCREFSLSSLRGRRGPGRGGPSCLRFGLGGSSLVPSPACCSREEGAPALVYWQDAPLGQSMGRPCFTKCATVITTDAPQ
jgi:hypothetical protein